MTDMVRIFNRREDKRKALQDVDSAIETTDGVLVEFGYDRRQKLFGGYELIGFGR